MTDSSVLPAGEHALPRATWMISALTVVSRVGGLLRDMAIAHTFGASGVADAFFIAFKVPNFVRRLFAEGAFAAGVVPVVSTVRERGPGAVRDLAAHLTGMLLVVGLPLTLLGSAGSGWLALLLAPGFARDPERLRLTGELLTLTLPYAFFMSLTAAAGGLLNAHRRFLVPAATPGLLNLCLIGAVLLVAPRLHVPVLALGWGVLAAGIVQVLVQVPALRRLDLIALPRFAWRHAGVSRVIELTGPAVFGASVGQINLLLDGWIASFLQPRSVSWLYYADRLLELPVGVLAAGVAVVSLPLLSAHHAAGRTADFSRTLDRGVRASARVVVPAALGLYFLAEPIVTTIFGHGAFMPLDGSMAALALQAYVVGLPGFVAVKLFAPAYFARHDTRTPVRIALWCVLLNVGLSVALMVPLGHVGLALATAAAALVNAALLWRGLVRAGIYRAGPGWRREFVALACGCAAMLATLWSLTHWQPDGAHWLALAPWARVWQLALDCVLGGAVYGATLIACGVRRR